MYGKDTLRIGECSAFDNDPHIISLVEIDVGFLLLLQKRLFWEVN